MKGLIKNPAYDSARYELGVFAKDGQQQVDYRHRFNTHPPADVKDFDAWVKENSIPPLIEIENP